MFLLQRDPFISLQMCVVPGPELHGSKVWKGFQGHVAFNKTHIALFEPMSSCCSTEICASTVNLSLLNP